MDQLFVANVPNLDAWGRHALSTHLTPRNYSVHTLDVTVAKCNAEYAVIVADLAKAIASARLSEEYLQLWESRVRNGLQLADSDREVIARALARGIARSKSDPVHLKPTVNSKQFKGHVVEVLAFCQRVHLRRKGQASPLIFQPRKPKACSATGGIDLLEIGTYNSGFYFTIWECKGTAHAVRNAFTEAAAQLCDEDKTAYQSFMEAHRALLEYPELKATSGLEQFVQQMPRLFYVVPSSCEKRLGGVVGCSSNGDFTETAFFAATVATSVHNVHPNCSAVVIRFSDFETYLQDVYEVLWNIY